LSYFFLLYEGCHITMVGWSNVISNTQTLTQKKEIKTKNETKVHLFFKAMHLFLQKRGKRWKVVSF